MLRFSFRCLRPCSRTSFHHQPEAQHPKSSAIHKLPADYPIFREQTGKHLLILSFSGFDRVVGPRADIPGPEQLVAVRIPLRPFQDPDGCETMSCVALTPGG